VIEKATFIPAIVELASEPMLNLVDKLALDLDVVFVEHGQPGTAGLLANEIDLQKVVLNRAEESFGSNSDVCSALVRSDFANDGARSALERTDSATWRSR